MAVVGGRSARRMSVGGLLMMTTVLASGWAAAPAFAQTPAASQTAERDFNIPAQSLTTALAQFGQQSGVQITSDGDMVRNIATPGVHGRMIPAEALSQLLTGTGLTFATTSTGTFALQRQAAQASGGNAIQLGPVRVEGQQRSGPPSTAVLGNLPPAYAGGQVARGGQVGLLGNKDVMDTPFNQTSYTSEFIQNQSASTVGDVLDNEPSLRRVGASSGAFDGYFSIRGFNVLSSDISFNGLYGLVPQYTGVPTEFVERVEVLKGASALLSGMSPNGALGGEINLVPKRATDQPITRGTVGLDSDALWTVEGDVGRRFGANGEWGLRVNGSYKNGDTYIDGQSRQRLLGSIALDYQGERLRLALDAYGFKLNNRGGDISGVSLDGRTTVPKAPSGRTNFAPGSGLDWDAKTGAAVLSGEYDISKAITAFAKIGVSQYDLNGVVTSAARTVQNNGDASLVVGQNPYRKDSVSGEVGLRSEFHTGALNHALTLSASWLKSNVALAGPYIYFPTNIYAPLPITVWPAVPTTVPKTSDSTLQGVAIADTMSTAEGRVQLTLGIRRQNVEAQNYATSGAVTSRYNKSAWTPAVGLVVKPVNNLSLYANYIEGLSQGTTVGTGYQNSGEVFPPYKTKQIEIGAKLETGPITNTVDLFQMEKPSTLTDNSTSPLPTLSLDGQQRNRGIEWNIFGEVSPGVRLLGGATYLQGRLTKTQGGLYDGNDAPGSAPFAVNIGGEWDPHWVPGLTLTGRVIYTSAQYVDSANTLKLPDWTRIDIGARYAIDIDQKPVVFRAGIKNLFDKNYWQGVGIYQPIAIIGAPRTFQISASVDF